ncbi:MAG: MBL fold metallo-hydrolase [Culicoidibacterales bacterium]
MKIHIIRRGCCKVIGCLLEEDKGLARIEVPAFIVYIEDELHGDTLIDTGYGTDFFDATNSFPQRLLRWAAPVKLESKSLNDRLTEVLNRKPEPERLIITHFHPDHIGALKQMLAEFPSIKRVVGSQKELETYNNMSKIEQIREGFIQSLIPKDFVFYDFRSYKKILLPINQFTSGYDVLGDGTLVIIPMLGHSVEHCGVYLPRNAFLFVGDAAYTNKSLTDRTRATKTMLNIAYDTKIYEQTYKKIQNVKSQYPKITIRTAHDFYYCEDYYTF